MLPQSKLIARFREGGATGSASNLFVEGDVLFSYGHHFPLAIRRDWGDGIQYLINGDRYSKSTAAHQQQCIRSLKPNVQVPFSALRAASLTDWHGLPHMGLRVVAWQPDRYYDICAHCRRDVTYVSDCEAIAGGQGCIHTDDSSPLCAAADEKTALDHQLGAVVLGSAGDHFLSSIDANENWRVRSYFLSKLPVHVVSVEEAFACLIPEEVRRAQTAGIEVHRQGDIFVIASCLRTREITGTSARGFHVFDTAHMATEARVNGAVYVRGVLRHVPQGRRPQHASLQLGKCWWVAYKNTAVASWNAVGNVD